MQAVSVALLLISFAAFLFFGSVPPSKEVILQVRLPEALLSFSVGAILSVGGATFQGIFRNPLADPYILGISASSAFGATVASLLGAPQEPLSALFSLISVGVIVFAGILLKDAVKLLLFGVILNAFFSALILFIYAVASSGTVQGAVFFTLGFIPSLSLKSSFEVLALSVVCLLLLLPFRVRLDALSMGDEISYFSGVSPFRERLIYLSFISVLVSIAVSKTGIIGFAGIVVPNTLRVLGARSFQRIIPLSFYAGGTFLLLSQLLARNVISPVQLPVGVVTAILGSPLFAAVLWRYSSVVKG